MNSSPGAHLRLTWGLAGALLVLDSVLFQHHLGSGDKEESETGIMFKTYHIRLSDDVRKIEGIRRMRGKTEFPSCFLLFLLLIFLLASLISYHCFE